MKRFASTLLILLVLAGTPNATAGEFPGVGDPNGWSDALPYYNMGNKYLSQERFGEAAQKFQEAIDRYPHDPDFYVNLGVALRKIEDLGAAEQAFKAALKLNDKDWMTWSNLGNVYLKQNRLKDTIAMFEKSMKCNPPASEKAAMIRDIGDIHKILRATGQEPFPEAAKAKGAAKTAAKTQPKKLSKPATATKPATGAGAPAPGTVTFTRSPGKDWGYE
jgi:tetratricopeptide (TPR) repeat protein